jgi:transposase InsO family protein
VIYTTISEMSSVKDSLPVSEACSLLDVSRSGYYDWTDRDAATPVVDEFEMKLKNEIQKIALKFTKYGYRRVKVELFRRGFLANSKYIRRLMREDNLLVVRHAFRPVTTDSNHDLPTYQNIAKHLDVTGLNQLWVADITYVQLVNEFVYLAVILDVFSRRCIGWNLSRNLDSQLTMGALKMALRRRRNCDLTGLVHHSDQGVQYASNVYVECLKLHGIQISMSRRGNPYDNAFAESFIKTLKCEEVYLTEYLSFQDALDNIGKFIEKIYNKKRLHSSIGYKPPEEFEMEVALNSEA